MRPPGPDFICIGLQKAGTGWLYDQLQFHPDFWMPPIKEFHYFDRTFPDETLQEIIFLAQHERNRLEKKRRKQNWRPLDQRDYSFFSDAEACSGREIDLARYSSLFRHKAELLSGDITPAYSTLNESRVKEIADYFQQVRIILLLRDPIARVWSQICMSWRRGKLPAETLDTPAAFRAYLETPQIRDRSFPTEIFRRWSRYIPEARLRYFFLDHIINDPDAARRDLLLFLGADPEKTSGALEPSFNRKSEQNKLELTDLPKQILLEYLGNEIGACAELFGEPAAAWKRQYGL